MCKNYVGLSEWEVSEKEKAFCPDSGRQRMLQQMAGPLFNSTPIDEDRIILNQSAVHALLNSTHINRLADQPDIESVEPTVISDGHRNFSSSFEGIICPKCEYFIPKSSSFPC